MRAESRRDPTTELTADPNLNYLTYFTARDKTVKSDNTNTGAYMDCGPQVTNPQLKPST